MSHSMQHQKWWQEEYLVNYIPLSQFSYPCKDNYEGLEIWGWIWLKFWNHAYLRRMSEVQRWNFLQFALHSFVFHPMYAQLTFLSIPIHHFSLSLTLSWSQDKYLGPQNLVSEGNSYTTFAITSPCHKNAYDIIHIGPPHKKNIWHHLQILSWILAIFLGWPSVANI